MKRQSQSPVAVGGVAVLGFPEPTSIPALWNRLVPSYSSRAYGPMQFAVKWNPVYAKQIDLISKRRGSNRIIGYLDGIEIERVKAKVFSKAEASIRFGSEKKGHGYNGERGDFCMVGGRVNKTSLVLFYRSLELIGGFAYDLVLIRELEKRLNCKFKTVTFITCRAFTFALKGNSNEKLFPKLQAIFTE